VMDGDCPPAGSSGNLCSVALSLISAPILPEERASVGSRDVWGSSWVWGPR
jgi:hypothetical protein